MNTSAIQSVLAQMRAVTAQSGLSAPAPQAGEAPAGGFAAELKRSLDGVSGAQDQAYGQAAAFERGEPGVALNDVMVDLQKASLGFQTVVAVRSRLVSAYQEVMNMQA
jgi:flagellar hook-basal body complex protein FliE